MSYPTDPPSPLGSNAVGPDSRLTPEDADQLAASFRPSWELEEAPFVAPGALGEGEMRAPREGGTQADVRGAVHALNGTHAPAPATVLHEDPASSVILDGSIAVENSPPAVSPLVPYALPSLPLPAASVAAVLVAPVKPLPATPASRFPQAAGPAARFPGGGLSAGPRQAPRLSSDAGDVRVARRSKLGLWLGLGAAGIGLAVGAWLASSAGEKRDAPAAAVETSQPVEPTRIPPPPPADTVTQTAAPTATAAAVQATAQAPVAQAPAAVPAVPPTPPPPAPHLVVPAAPRPPTWNPSAAPKPAPRPKAVGPTIVRDVPF